MKLAVSRLKWKVHLKLLLGEMLLGHQTLAQGLEVLVRDGNVGDLVKGVRAADCGEGRGPVRE